MSPVLLYTVCASSAIDTTTGACTAVQYVQAPSLIPPLDAAGGFAIATAIIALWALASVYRKL